jgi:predicted ribosomally synthesized peptide with SipW-like signal peptide
MRNPSRGEKRQLEKRYFIIIQRWSWLILLAAVLATLVVYTVTGRQAQLYEARTRLLVGPGIETLNPDLNAMRAGGRLMQTYAELVHTEPFLHEVRNRLGLSLTPEQLGSRINVRVNQETQILTVEVQHEVPLQAALIAHTVGEQLVNLSPAATSSTERIRHDQMQRQAATLENELVEIEAALLQLEVQLNATLDVEAQQQIRAEMARERGRLLELHQTLAGVYEVLQTANSNQLTIIEPVGSVAPVPTWRSLQLLLGAASGLALSLLAVVTFAYLSDSVESPLDLAEMTHAPVLGAIPRHAHILSPTYRPLVAHTAPGSAAAASYQVLAAKLLYAADGPPLNTILCSGLPGSQEAAEVAANLGLVMAQAGSRVLLVDANLHHAYLSDLFAVAERPGLSEVLTGRAPLPRITPLSWAPGLSLITAGQTLDGAFSLLASPGLGELLAQLQRQVDKVVLLGPTLLAYGHSLFLAARVDGVLLVANRGQTRYGALNEAISRLNGVGANVLGTVLKNSNSYVASSSRVPGPAPAMARPEPEAYPRLKSPNPSSNGREAAQIPAEVDES